jgi:DNA-directed RNA polymerase specialized sigma24 family protein
MPSANPRFELLNSLFYHREVHREQIITILQELATLKAGNLQFACSDDARDAISNAMLLAIRKLHCYRPQQNAACTYFGRLMTRDMIKFIRQQKLTRCQHDTPISGDETGASLIDKGTSPWGKPLPPRVDCRLEGESDRARAASVIDDALRGAMAERDLGDADTCDKAELAIAILQMIRKRLLGRFNRMVADRAIRDGQAAADAG